MSSREHYWGDTSVFSVKLQGGHKCLPVNTTGGTKVSSWSNEGGTFRFLLPSSPSLMEGSGDTLIKNHFKETNWEELLKPWGERSCHVDTHKKVIIIPCKSHLIFICL